MIANAAVVMLMMQQQMHRGYSDFDNDHDPVDPFGLFLLALAVVSVIGAIVFLVTR